MTHAAIRKTVVFSHGKESGPWGIKITRLARVAESLGFEVISIDYRGVFDPEERVRMLLAQCPAGQGCRRASAAAVSEPTQSPPQREAAVISLSDLTVGELAEL